MLTLDAALLENMQAYERFVAAVKRVPGGAWATPVAPGKWTPAQIAEHIAISFDIATGALKGESGIPGMPRLVRPLIRALFFRRILKTKTFPRNAKSPKVFHPSETSAPLTQTLDRLARGSAGLDAAVAALRQSGETTIEHPVFGTIPVEEYLELNAIHTRHHMGQLPASGATVSA